MWVSPGGWRHGNAAGHPSGEPGQSGAEQALHLLDLGGLGGLDGLRHRHRVGELAVLDLGRRPSRSRRRGARSSSPATWSGTPRQRRPRARPSPPRSSSRACRCPGSMPSPWALAWSWEWPGSAGPVGQPVDHGLDLGRLGGQDGVRDRWTSGSRPRPRAMLTISVAWAWCGIMSLAKATSASLNSAPFAAVWVSPPWGAVLVVAARGQAGDGQQQPGQQRGGSGELLARQGHQGGPCRRWLHEGRREAPGGSAKPRSRDGAAQQRQIDSWTSRGGSRSRAVAANLTLETSRSASTDGRRPQARRPASANRTAGENGHAQASLAGAGVGRGRDDGSRRRARVEARPERCRLAHVARLLAGHRDRRVGGLGGVSGRCRGRRARAS